MMRRRRRSLSTGAGLMLSPMIDLIFLLLVFFVVSTMYMSNIQTIPVVLPKAEHSEHVKRRVDGLSLSKRMGRCIWRMRI